MLDGPQLLLARLTQPPAGVMPLVILLSEAETIS